MPEIVTVRDHIAWSYANLARASAAFNDGASRYRTEHYKIRALIFRKLQARKISMSSLFRDERQKIMFPQVCAYCGGSESLSLDHLFPRCRGGLDDGFNLVLACRPCNSSKGGRDMLRWMSTCGAFPSIVLLRRYLKLVARRCEALGILDEPLESVLVLDLPFALELLPHTFPPFDQLVYSACGSTPKATRSRAPSTDAAPHHA